MLVYHWDWQSHNGQFRDAVLDCQKKLEYLKETYTHMGRPFKPHIHRRWFQNSSTHEISISKHLHVLHCIPSIYPSMLDWVYGKNLRSQSPIKAFEIALNWLFFLWFSVEQHVHRPHVFDRWDIQGCFIPFTGWHYCFCHLPPQENLHNESAANGCLQPWQYVLYIIFKFVQSVKSVHLFFL